METTTLTIDVIVATVGRSHEVDRLLSSIAAQNQTGCSVIVVDQNVDDRLGPILARHTERVPLRRIRTAPGLSRARNLGLAHSTAAIVAFADDDCWYPTDTLTTVIQYLERDPELGGVCGRVVADRPASSNPRWDSTRGPVNQFNVWKRAVSAGIFLRSDVLRHHGGFDERLGLGAATPFGSGEETELLLRILRAGTAINYEPSIVVFHATNRSDFGSEDRHSGYRYGVGMGHVQRMYNPWWFGWYYVGRACAGAGLSLGRARGREARFHLAVARGRARGWLHRPHR